MPYAISAWAVSLLCALAVPYPCRPAAKWNRADNGVRIYRWPSPSRRATPPSTTCSACSAPETALSTRRSKSHCTVLPTGTWTGTGPSSPRLIPNPIH